MPIPYAQAGVEKGLATATCPVCSEVFTGKDSKQAVHEYGVHYAEKHETSVESIVTALKAAGLDAYENADLGPCLINVFAKGYDVHLSNQFNREDGGWEAAADNDGEVTPLDDGPALVAPVEEVVAWVVTIIKGLARLDGGREALFSGDWLLEDEDDLEKGYRLAFEGVVYDDGWWSGGVQWHATVKVAEALISEQNRLIEESSGKDSSLGRITIVRDANNKPVSLVTYEPSDGEFYTQLFTDDGLVQVPSWTWFEVTEKADVIKEIVR